MQIRKIELANFRNLRDGTIEMPAGGSFIIGRNAQGKTNLLESVYYLGTMRSFRTRRDAELIRFGEGYFRVRGEIARAGGTAVVEVAYDGRRKLVKVNGASPERIRDAFGALKVVIVTPDDVELVRAFPAARRRFLDIVLSMTFPRYLETLARYHEVLLQRNALLKVRHRDRGSIPAWDPQLARLAAGLASKRREFLAEFSPSYREVHRRLDPTCESELTYQTSPREAAREIEGCSEEDVARFYEASLRNSYEKDRELGTTTMGPHRDDVLFRLGGKDLRSFGSLGQQRTAVFALRIAEARYLEKKVGEGPVLLMDDVFSQLDEERGSRLMDMVTGVYQTIITTPREENARYAAEGISRMRVEDGKIEPAEQ